jgi:hypothetical protein
MDEEHRWESPPPVPQVKGLSGWRLDIGKTIKEHIVVAVESTLHIHAIHM